MEYGLIGEKLGHSYSKIIHEKIADYDYQIQPLSREEFPVFMKKRAFKAINVTIPYKQDVIPYLDEMDGNASLIGAVNTIINKNGRLIGYNTDFSGFLYMAEHHNVKLNGRKILVLGNGGASKAILAVLKRLQAGFVVIVDIIKTGSAITYEECFKQHTDAEVIINTSPVGMFPNVDAAPIDLNRFEKCRVVLDIIYNPLETTLIKQGISLGIKAVGGLEMLVAQAVYAVELFLEKKMDPDTIDSLYKKVLKEI